MLWPIWGFRHTASFGLAGTPGELNSAVRASGAETIRFEKFVGAEFGEGRNTSLFLSPFLCLSPSVHRFVGAWQQDSVKGPWLGDGAAYCVLPA